MKKTIRKISAALSAAVIFASCLTASASAVPVKTDNELQISYAAKTDPNNYTGWRKDTVGSRYYVNGVLQTKSRVIDGIRYKISADGYSQGKYTGWTKSSQGRRYWKNGKILKNKWIKTSSGKLYYANEKGYMTVGWSDVTRIGGAYSYFDENGVWDGKVYWSKTNPEATRENMLTETVRIKIKPIETVFGSDIKWSKKEKQYLEDNSSYELQIPLTASDTLSVGDTILVKSKVTRGEKKNGVYEYYLTVAGWQPLVYFGSIGSYPYYMIADSDENGILDENEYIHAFEERLELFNNFLLIRDDKLVLDRMFQVLGLSWEEINSNKEFVNYFEDVRDGIYCRLGTTAYGLFGGYNRLNDETGEYVYHDGMSEQELIDLMKEVNTGGFWLKAEIEEIPAV